MTITSAELDARFAYHPLKKLSQVAEYGQIREQGRVLAGTIVSLVPEGREQSLALTKLEEAITWARTGIARRGFEDV